MDSWLRKEQRNDSSSRLPPRLQGEEIKIQSRTWNQKRLQWGFLGRDQGREGGADIRRSRQPAGNPRLPQWRLRFPVSSFSFFEGCFPVSSFLYMFICISTKHKRVFLNTHITHRCTCMYTHPYENTKATLRYINTFERLRQQSLYLVFIHISKAIKIST